MFAPGGHRLILTAVFLAVFSPAPALPCSVVCVGQEPFVLPQEGETAVPTNAVVLIYRPELPYGQRPVLRRDDGPAIAGSYFRVSAVGMDPLLFVSDERLEGSQEYEVVAIDDAGNEEILTHFETGTSPAEGRPAPLALADVSAWSAPYLPLLDPCGIGGASEITATVPQNGKIVIVDVDPPEQEDAEDTLPASLVDLDIDPGCEDDTEECPRTLPGDYAHVGDDELHMSNRCGPLSAGYLQTVRFRAATIDLAGNISEWSAWSEKTIPPPFMSCTHSRAAGKSAPWPFLLASGLLFMSLLAPRRPRHR